MDFWRAVGILNNRKWLIILSVIAATGLTWGATRLVGAKWIAEVKFISLSNSPLANLASKGDMIGDPGGSQRDRDRKMVAQIEAVLKSREVVEPALFKMNRVRFPEGLLSRVEVGLAGPGLYYMRYTDSSDQRATTIANALAESFVERFQQMGTEQAQKTVDLLDNQYKQATARLTESRQRFAKFRAEKRINAGNLTAQIDSADQQMRSVSARRDSLTQQLADARAQLAAKERELIGIPPTITVPGTTRPNEAIKDLRKDLNEKTKAYSILAARYNPTHPMMVKAKEDIDNTKAELDKATASPEKDPDQVKPNPIYEQVKLAVGQLKQSVAGYEAQVPTVMRTVGEAQRDFHKFSGVDDNFSILANEITLADEFRSNLMNRLNAAEIALDAARSQQPLAIADLVSPYNPPLSATEGRTLKLIILAFIGALLGTSALVIALDSVDRRVKTVSQAELALPARVIAAIPQPMGSVTYSTLARATEVHPSSLHSEAYRFLGLQLLSPRGPRVRSLMVLSAKAEQGSTTTVTNLAITLAQAGKRVILVDANVRTAELHQVFEIENEFGFTDLLRDPSNENLDRALRPTGVGNLQIITTGPMTDNVWQLFRSENMIELSRRMHERADFVLYDTPSALIFTDALNLAPVVDAAYLCVRALEPLTGAEQRVVELLEQSNVTVLGSVLNDVPTAVVEGYHNYQHYYGAAAPAIAARTEMGGAPMLEMSHRDAGNGKNGLS